KFFGKQVLGETDETKFKERNIRVEKLGDMLALHNRKLPDNALDFDGVRELWIRLGRAASVKPDREALELALGAEWPKHVIAESDGDKFLLTREGRGDRVTGFKIPGE